MVSSWLHTCDWIFWLLEQFYSSLWNSFLFILKVPSQAWFSTLSHNTVLTSGESHSEYLCPCPISFKHQPLGQWAGLRKKEKSLGLLIGLIKAPGLQMLLFRWLTSTGHWMPPVVRASKYWFLLAYPGSSEQLWRGSYCTARWPGSLSPLPLFYHCTHFSFAYRGSTLQPLCAGVCFSTGQILR